MAQTSWPFHDGTSGTPVLEDQWSKMARTWSQSGVVSYGNNLGPYSDSDGRQVKVPTGRAIVRGHYYENASPTKVLAIAANASGNPRIDRVVLRLDPSANSVTLAVLQGTPAGSPSAPALTQTDVGVFEISLARVTVANGATNIVPADVIDERTFIGPPLPLLGGTMTGALTLSGAPTSALHAATKQYVDDKGTWSSWTPVVYGGTTALTGCTVEGRKCVIGKTVHWNCKIVMGASTGGSGTLNVGGDLPEPDQYRGVMGSYTNDGDTLTNRVRGYWNGLGATPPQILTFVGVTLPQNGVVFYAAGTYESA